MLNHHFADNRSIVAGNFHEIDPCRKIACGYRVFVTLHLAVVEGLPMKVINGKFSVVQ